ncbi:hypothetical protein Poli38472_003495 [Pythium oligandrum]|uniref:PNPLA domain-containing protein n=1 Tax=Pythium oligandrum TaxID=41045 RepID=A0A8K1FBR9_PYTOL|nr:hypothetical protein Poli38472_003495 [Pythium oligandrum]|eukprot:TMW57570.1 hypothetical protein Poli38472_003495 [Pythium oligandrum]
MSSSVLQHSTSADDLLLRPHESAQDAAFGDVDAAKHAHSDDELDAEEYSISVQRPLSDDKDETLPLEIAFSASAGAFVYQMGVAAYIQDHFDVSNCHFSGCSGGAWAATLLAAGTSVHEAWEVIQKIQKKVVPANVSWYSGYGRYATIIAETIMNLWKDDPDVYKRVTERNLSIAVTRFPSMTSEKHTTWDDLEDLMRSIMASAMIPFALSGKPCVAHRGNWYVDGGFTNFKGVNCDQYSTWSDLFYHTKQLAVDSVRSTTNAVTDYFFPSLSKPIANLIHHYLPSFESPHDAIAPRLANAPANPQGVNGSTPSRPRLIIKPWTWRSQSVLTYHLAVDIPTHQKRFDMGYDDARAHHYELAELLTPLSG